MLRQATDRAASRSRNAMAMPSWTLLAIPLLMFAQPARAQTGIDETALPRGSFEMTTRLELPHVERWAIDKTTTICLSGLAASGQIPIPILSANNPYARCTAANLVIDEDRLEYDVICPGRGAAKAHAAYSLGPDSFAGRVAMVLGGKNMTMTEVQRARRVGTCDAPRQDTGPQR
jgi:hypothetical protein